MIEFKKVVNTYVSGSNLGTDRIQFITLAPCDFENLERVSNALEVAVYKLRAEPYNLELKDITIDVTAGQKTASIAAATITFQSALEFSYVNTNPPGTSMSSICAWR